MNTLQPELAAPAHLRVGPKVRLTLLVLEGYGYLLGTIATFVAVVGVLVWGVLARQPVIGLLALFVGVPAVLLTASGIRSLLLPASEPSGVPMAMTAAPSLFKMIEDVRRQVGCPALDSVIFVTACNASALQTGALFWRRRFLLIGYPLLLVLSPVHVKAVVGHELAHFANGDSRLAALVYRTRTSWLRLAETLQERGTMPIFVRWVLSGYLPRLEAGSAEISRAHEFFADRVAATVSSPRAAAEALVAIDIAGRILERKVWPALNESSVGEDAPFRPFARLACKPHPLADAATNAEVLEALLDAPAHPHDSHPSLRERLNALGATAELPGPPARSAADAIIGPMHSVIAAQLDADWDRRHGDAWRRRKRTLRRAASRLAELEAQTPGAEQSLERGALLEKLSREAEALEAYHSALKYDPDSGKAALGAGRLLLEKGESAGADLIQRSMELDVSLLPAACEILVGHYTSQRRFADAERCRARLTRYHTRAKLLQEACSTPRLPADL